MTEQVFSTNPMARGLNEAKVTPIAEGKTVSSFTDHNGDLWKRHDDLKRNSTHPHYVKPATHQSGANAVSVDNNPTIGWHNQRTNEVHEGGIRIHLDGKGSIDGGSYNPNPRLYHIEHYEGGASHYGPIRKGSR